MNLTQEEIKNILVLISRAQITGQEATATAVLQQKLSGMLEAPAPTEEPKK
jgi:hypothetical protein